VYKLINDDISNAIEDYGSGFFDLIITSPPYNIGKEYETRKNIDDYLDEQRSIVNLLVDRLSDQGSICWQVGNYVDNGEVFPLDTYFYDMFKSLGLKLRNRIIWHFEHGLHAKKRFSGRYETILWFTKSDDYIFNLDSVRIPSKYPGKRHFKGPHKGELSGNPQGKNPSDAWSVLERDWDSCIWEIPNVKSNHPEKTSHPCQYPVELAERCILALTSDDSWVLDPYMGVGSSVIAATKNGRNAVGVDRTSEYVQIAQERLDLLKRGELITRPMTKAIYQPTQNNKQAQMPVEWR
jgi:DNA modification methylase